MKGGDVSSPLRSACVLVELSHGYGVVEVVLALRKEKESKQFARILVQAFHLWYPVHCRDRSETFNIPSEDEPRVGSRKSSGCRRAV